MNAISIIIIAKNSAATIQAAIKSALLVSADVIVMDSGSSDGTQQLSRRAGATVIETEWLGYGKTRNKGAILAINEFVLSLDSDEVISEKLANSICSTSFDPAIIYGFKRNNFIGEKQISHGEWGSDKVYRLYNKFHASWNLDEVHEVVESKTNSKLILPGSLQHYTTDDINQYALKLHKYAALSAAKYKAKNKKGSLFKNYLSAPFSFIKNYFFRLGLLDGKEGWDLALLHARYTYTKYKILREQKNKPD